MGSSGILRKKEDPGAKPPRGCLPTILGVEEAMLESVLHLSGVEGQAGAEHMIQVVGPRGKRSPSVPQLVIGGRPSFPYLLNGQLMLEHLVCQALGSGS